MQQVTKRYYEDVEVGDELGPVDKMPDVEVVRLLLKLWGRSSGPSKFDNLEAARRDGLPEPIVPADVVMGYFWRLLTEWTGSIDVRKLELIQRQRLFHNRTIRIIGLVTDKAIVDGKGCMECDLFALDAHGERLATGKGLVVVPCRGLS